MNHPKDRFERRKVNQKYSRRKPMDTPEINTFTKDISVGNIVDLLRPQLEDFLRRSTIIKESDDVIEVNLEPFFPLTRDDTVQMKYTIQKIKDG
jgi:hypothetical protein